MAQLHHLDLFYMALGGRLLKFEPGAHIEKRQYTPVLRWEFSQIRFALKTYLLSLIASIKNHMRVHIWNIILTIRLRIPAIHRC
jgi:hypothetical protein